MPSHITSHPNGKKCKSSPKARKLIEAVVKQCGGNEREAARRLLLPNHAQLRKMRRGQIGDTPAMRAALARADERARRAWRLARTPPQAPTVSMDYLRAELRAIRVRLDALDHLLKGPDNDEAKGL